MSILTVILLIVIVGVGLWAINTYLPMQPGIKKLLNIVVIVFLIIFLLQAFGLFDGLRDVKINK